jgi:hypothetical protein
LVQISQGRRVSRATRFQCRCGDPDGLAEQIIAFEQHYNATARPFDWKSSRKDLNGLLTCLSQHDSFAPQPLAA